MSVLKEEINIRMITLWQKYFFAPSLLFHNWLKRIIQYQIDFFYVCFLQFQWYCTKRKKSIPDFCFYYIVCICEFNLSIKYN